MPAIHVLNANQTAICCSGDPKHFCDTCKTKVGLRAAAAVTSMDDVIPPPPDLNALIRAAHTATPRAASSAFVPRPIAADFDTPLVAAAQHEAAPPAITNETFNAAIRAAAKGVSRARL